MISSESIRELIALYVKHGWLIRRVLLSEPVTDQLKSQVSELFGDTPVNPSGIDAIWFSRPYKREGMPWEIRHLGGLPYALVEHVDQDSESFEDDLRTVEERLKAAISSRTTA